MYGYSGVGLESFGVCRECEGLQGCRNLQVLGVVGSSLKEALGFGQVLNYV